MSELEFDENAFRQWVDSGSAPRESYRIATERDGQKEVWDAAVLDADVRQLAAEYLALAQKATFGRKGGDLVMLKKVAQMPPMSAEYIVNAAYELLGKYALYQANQLLCRELLQAMCQLALGARQEGIIPKPPRTVA